MIANGIIEVTIIENTSRISTHIIRDLVITAEFDKYGELVSQFHYVIICLPQESIIGDSAYWTGHIFDYH